MKRALVSALVVIAAMASGCTMCCDRWYHTYSGYGGTWQRTDPEHGRVGSAFTDAGVHVEPGEESDAEPAAPDRPGPRPAPPPPSDAPPPGKTAKPAS